MGILAASGQYGLAHNDKEKRLTSCAPSVPAVRPERSPALDFFRGLALIVIFINHMPFNPWYWGTPSRFGFSDATEIFVFVSGFVAALAYGRRFRESFRGGTLRVLQRCVQVYFAHILMFGLLALVCVLGNQSGIGPDYIKGLNLGYAFDHPAEALKGLLTLRYVPNYFDILPMYLVIMAMIPLVWLLAQYNRALALLAPVALYAATRHYGWELNAEMTFQRPWYFNPLSWQLLFFTGFAFAANWLPHPRWNRALAFVCLFILAASAVIEYGATFFASAPLNEMRGVLAPYFEKSHFSLLRYVHFLSLAYVMSHAAAHLSHVLAWLPFRLVAQLGRQSLTAFVTAMILSYTGGMALDFWGRDLPTVAAINIAGLVIFFTTVRAVGLLAHTNPQPALRAPAALPHPATG